jgi:hypothetical protein
MDTTNTFETSVTIDQFARRILDLYENNSSRLVLAFSTFPWLTLIIMVHFNI